MKNNLVFIIFTLLAVGIFSNSFFWEKPISAEEAAAPIQTGNINGMVATELYFEQEASTVYLPDINVIIRDLDNNTLSKTTTDVHGWYSTEEVPYDTYLLCLEKSGYQPVCNRVKVNKPQVYPGLQIIPLDDPKSFIYGESHLKDGKPGFFLQEYYGIEFYTYISLAGHRTSYRCNSVGKYVIPFMVNSKTKIKAVCQNAVTTKYVYAGTNTRHMPIKNTSPKVLSMLMYENGIEVDRTAPGAKLKVVSEVDDAEGHPLTYKWFPWGNHPGFTSPNNPITTWTIPNVPASYNMYLVVNDGYGGIGIKKRLIRAVDRRVLFSGTVRVLGSPNPVVGAEIDVNGETTFTDGNGFFSMTVSESAGRYVLNIDKPGMMAQSKIYFKDATSIDYNLVTNTTSVFSSQEEITLIEQEDEITRFRTTGPQGETIIRPPAIVRIPPNAIIDENGEPFNGQVMASLRAIDLFDGNNLMPGDFGALEDGEDKTLESFGAIDVQLRDSNKPEVKLQIDPEVFAEISIPISSPLESTAQENITLWDYDTKEGFWINIGSLKREGDYYVGFTNMFSTLNADVSFSDAACLEIRDNPVTSLFPGEPLTFVFQVPTSSGGAPKVISKVINNAADLPLFVSRLPENENVTMTISRIDPTDPTDIDTIVKIAVLFTGPGAPGTANANPSTGDCKFFYIDVDTLATPTPIFLYRENNDVTQAIDYYDLIDATTGGVANYDLNSWKLANDFGGPDTTALYYNAGDLGFWRDMHVRTKGNKTAFYVTNYPTDADAIAGTGAIATVCMEFNAVNGSANTSDMTKFYVFDGSNALVNNADLDGSGAKYIPNLCVVCHGGSSTDYSAFLGDKTDFVDHYTGINVDKMPNFIHFDVESFAYSTASGKLRSDQETELRELNEKIMQVQNTTAITDFIKTAYGAPVTASNTAPLPTVPFIDRSVVPAWDNLLTPGASTVTNDTMYMELIGPSCRACHVTRTNDFLWFDEPADFAIFSSSIRNAVCSNGGSVPYMPNALVTYKNLWTDSTRVETFKNYLGGLCENPY